MNRSPACKPPRLMNTFDQTVKQVFPGKQALSRRLIPFGHWQQPARHRSLACFVAFGPSPGTRASRPVVPPFQSARPLPPAAIHCHASFKSHGPIAWPPAVGSYGTRRAAPYASAVPRGLAMRIHHIALRPVHRHGYVSTLSQGTSGPPGLRRSTYRRASYVAWFHARALQCSSLAGNYPGGDDGKTASEGQASYTTPPVCRSAATVLAP